jgi:hypothetical protein
MRLGKAGKGLAMLLKDEREQIIPVPSLTDPVTLYGCQNHYCHLDRGSEHSELYLRQDKVNAQDILSIGL